MSPSRALHPSVLVLALCAACSTQMSLGDGGPDAGAGGAGTGSAGAGAASAGAAGTGAAGAGAAGAGAAGTGAAGAGVAGAGAAGAGGGTGTCVLTDTYTFGWNGGLVAYSDESTLSPPDHYRHVRMSFRGAAPSTKECSPALPACGAQDTISLLDILRDLADADVKAAFAQATPPLYGVDSRPVDGQVYAVTRADGHGVLVGGPCGTPTRGGCRAIPRGLQALVDHLKMLDEAQLDKPACADITKP
jgi:hypothetical protein